MKFLVTLERDEEGWVVAECPSLPGCVSQGRTIDEALANIREAIELSLDTRRELGMTTEIEIAEVDVEPPAE
ncbi:MAG TPA: type II toxin-antitoxin system HicB family antitoxin [Candidatus Binataceae bacterium]|nr:type II toxin-antitoxin system HicB family antitoxin [Candidatus Binataceae bacterium]